MIVRPSRHLPLALAALLAATLPAAAQPQGTCADTIRAVLADIAARDLDTSAGPPLNAFVALNPSAVAQAEALDRAVAGGAARGALHCMPVAVKDNFETYDLPTTVGSLSLLGNQPVRDAIFVDRLRKAGAIVVGKTNMDEFAMGIRGLSGSGGRTGNAYDTNQSSGGSSAGSAVAVGTGFVPLAVGSDNCGSLRLPAVYNGAVSLRATLGRFKTDGIFPIGFVNGVPGLIARDVATLNDGLAVAGDGWRADAARGGTLRGKRIGILRQVSHDNLWDGADGETRSRFDAALALMKREGAELVEGVEIPAFNLRLGPEFLRGFARRANAQFASYPASRRTWRDVCTSERVRPEWSARTCSEAGASNPFLERRAVDRIASNAAALTAAMDRLKLDALVHPADARGGARNDVSDKVACFVAGASGLPAAAFPVARDARGLPMGLEFLGRAGDDEKLVALMGAFEAARGPFPPARRVETAAQPVFDLMRINAVHRRLGYEAFRSRRGEGLGDLEPARFRDLTRRIMNSPVSP